MDNLKSLETRSHLWSFAFIALGLINLVTFLSIAAVTGNFDAIPLTGVVVGGGSLAFGLNRILTS